MSLYGRLENCKIGGCKEIRQPFANPSPTLCQPFANPLPTFCQPFANLFRQPLSNPLVPWTPGSRLETRVNGFLVHILLGQKSCRTKVSRIFGIFVPDFAPNFAPNFPRIFQGLFVLRFVGDGDQKKFTKNPRHFSMQNSQANTKNIFIKFFWRAGKVTSYCSAHELK